MNKGFEGPPWPSERTNFDRNLAVLIGIDQYNSNHIANLSTAVSDAEALATLLEQDFFNQPKDRVIRLFQPHAEPTLSELQTLLTDTLPNKLKPGRGDRLIIYFAGHGLPLNSDGGPAGYLVPQDTDLGKPESLLSMQTVYEELSKLQCHHLLVILDCCFAGRFRWATSRKLLSALSTIHREHYDRFIRYPAWQVITSAAHDQEALDAVKVSADQRGSTSDGQHSPFALALLEALGDGAPDKKAVRYKNADYTRDGVVTAHELLVYLQHRVSELSQERQAPGLYPLRREFDKGEFIFTSPNFDAHSLQPAPDLNEDNNPYRGLNPFDERHAQFFFGRQALVKELIEKLNQPDQVLTTVLGVSGSGKSSLVRAGLIPQLRQPEFKGWNILAPLRPGESPLRALARTLLPIAAPELIQRVEALTTLDQQFSQIVEQHQPSPYKLNQPSPAEQSGLTIALVWANASPGAKLLLLLDYRQEIGNFLENNVSPEEKEKVEEFTQEIGSSLDEITSNLQNNPQALREIVQAWHQNAVGEKILLVIDQFEELITLAPEASGMNEADTAIPFPHQSSKLPFLSLLQEAVTHCTDSLRIVVTLRSDFEPRFLESPLQPSWKNSRFPIRAMTSDELRQAIEGPALKQALYFEPESLVGKLVDEVGQMPGALPLLSFTLSELYIKLFERWKVDETTGRALRLEDYEELGGVAGALTQRATAIYEALDEKHRITLQRVMLRMVTIEGGGIARRRVPQPELMYPYPDESSRLNLVINRLVNARLVVRGQEAGEPYLEPAHDLLIQEWDKIQGWIQAEQENLLLQQRLIVATNDWIVNQEVDANQADNFLWSNDPRLDLLKEIKNQENSWLNSLEHEFIEMSLQKRKIDYETRLKAILSRQLAAQARNLISSQPDLALLLASEAYKAKDTNETRECLLYSLKEYGYLRIFLHEHKSEIIDLAFSPDGSKLATLDYSGAIGIEEEPRSRLFIWDHKTCELIHEIESAKAFSCISWAGSSCDIGIAISNPRLAGKSLGKHGFVAGFTLPPRSGTSPTLKNIRILGLSPDLLKKNDLTGHRDDISQILFSKDGSTLISGDKGGNIFLWDVATRTRLAQVQGNSEPVVNLKWLEVDQEFISVEGPWIRVRSLPNLVVSQEFPRFERDIDAVDISSDGTVLAILAYYRGQESLLFYNFSKKEYDGFPLTEYSGAVFDIAFNDVGNIIFTAGGGGNTGIEAISAWEVSSHQKITTLLAGFNHSVNKLSLSPDGNTLAAGGSDRKVTLWDLSKNTPIPETLLDFPSPSLCVASNSSFLGFALGHANGSIGFYNVDCLYNLNFTSSINNIEPFQCFECPENNPVIRLVYSEDGRYLVSVQASGNITLWDCEKKSIIHSVPSCHSADITDVTIFLEKNLISTCSLDGSVALWSMNPLETIGFLPLLERDRKMLIVQGVEDEENKQPETWPIYGLCFCPKQLILVAVAQNGLRCWNVHDRKPIELHWLSSAGAGADFSGRGITLSVDKELLITANSTKLRFWNPENLDHDLEERDEHLDSVIHIAFDPDNNHFASYGGNEIIFWERKRPEPLGRFRVQEYLTDLSYTQDGRLLIGCTRNGQTICWQVHPESWVRHACRKANRELNFQERQRYLDAEI